MVDGEATLTVGERAKCPVCPYWIMLRMAPNGWQLDLEGHDKNCPLRRMWAETREAVA